ncbi:7-deoxyloganetic acid glucosyltransferase [Ziziphus jujuba]|uniref:7-deoxyloganetic acid glucosyltransferase n=1 Tax=Ziziphus jujuba TaxID=326968 RepID=A0A6P6GM19_ZIZJJ|nr:7-deoxyloganetic acid glucosyltransferase [Ziziphus jujuba]
MEGSKVKMEQAHVVMFPFILQGHIKVLLSLGELLSEAGLYVTFVNTHQNHKRLANLQALTTHFPNLHFESISDGLPDDHPRTLFQDFFEGMKTKTKPNFKELIVSLNKKSENGLCPPVTCIIGDGVMSFPIEVADDLGIPIFSFYGTSARFLWAFFNIPKLVEEGQIPFFDDNMNYRIHGIPGLEGLLRRKDLPEFCALKEIDHNMINFFVEETLAITKTSGLIFNTFDELEIDSVQNVATKCSKLYTVAPINALLQSQIGPRAQSIASLGSLWDVEQNCIKWLDSQPSKSVVYVSFGSITKSSISQLKEFWHGLVDSGHPFLWVIRPGAILDEEVIPKELEKGQKERGYVVDWAPQEEVMAHKALGGFLNQSGWNSILESIVAGVPMICWPYSGDHFINCQCVTKVWKIGLELGDWDRLTIKTTIKELMGSRREEFQESVDKAAQWAKNCISKGGSSSLNLEKLIKDIKGIKEIKV